MYRIPIAKSQRKTIATTSLSICSHFMPAHWPKWCPGKLFQEKLRLAFKKVVLSERGSTGHLRWPIKLIGFYQIDKTSPAGKISWRGGK